MPLALDLAMSGRTIAGGEEPCLRHSKASAEVVRKINQGVVKGCKSLVYSHEQTDELRRFVMRHRPPLPSPLMAGRSFRNNPESMTGEDIQRMMDRFNELRRRERESEDTPGPP
jgi:hypothetical protein